MDNRIRRWCCLLVLIISIACGMTYAADEVFIPKVYESLQWIDVDFRLNQVLYKTGNTLYACELDTGKRRWWKPLFRQEKHYHAGLGKDYAVIYCEEEFQVLDKETGQLLWKEHAGRWQSIRFMRFEDQTNWLWDTETGKLIRTIDPELPQKRGDGGFIRNTITLSGNGAYALTYNTEGFDTGTLWDLEKGVKIRCYTFEGASQIDAAVSEDGDRVYAIIDGDLHYLAGAKKDD